MESNGRVTAKEQNIGKISASTAKGDIPKLKINLAEGLDAGLTVSEIKEGLVQLYAYCGFPRSLNAINAFIAVLEMRKAQSIIDDEGRDASPVNNRDKYETSKRNLYTLTGI